MIKNQLFFEQLKQNGITFFSNVPDSLLKDILSYIEDNTTGSENITAQNEGGAVALAVGHFLATGQLPMVTFQNSGWGHALNPLLSLARVYKVPMLLMIGWRGEPGVADAVQHSIDGKRTKQLLASAQLPFEVLAKQPAVAEKQLKKLIAYAKKTTQPVALLVRKDTFETYRSPHKTSSTFSMSRERALSIIVKQLKAKDRMISTTGMASREVNEIVQQSQLDQNKFFYIVGSMGHTSLLALKVALEQPNITVYCVDGDGAVLMHMGALPIIAAQHPKNFIHIVLNNGAHDSVGGQPTVALDIDLPAIALASGYSQAISVVEEKQLKLALKDFASKNGPLFLEVKVNKGARHDLSRPSSDTVGMKQNFMASLTD